MDAATLSLIVALTKVGMDWLVKELMLAKQQGEITDAQFRALLAEAANSDARFDLAIESVKKRLSVAE